MKKEVQLIENKELREQMISRIEVLDRVKKIITLPNTDFMTTKMVAEYYNVDKSVIEKTVERNRQELNTDGLSLKNRENLLADNMSVKTKRGGFDILDDNGNVIESGSNKGILLFPKRAILRVGMLLRDSEIAKEVRTRLLDIVQDTEDKTPEIIQQVTTEISIEQQLKLDVMEAYDTGDRVELLIATSKLNKFKDEMHDKRVRQLEGEKKWLETTNNQLENDNKALAQGILSWVDRSKLNYGIRRLSCKANIQIGQLWNEFYRQLLYKYHISLKARGDKPWLRHVKEDEWNDVIKCFSALCELYKQSPTLLLNELEVN